MDEASGSRRASGILAGIAVLMLAICVLYATMVWLLFGDWEASGVFGDSFGALNSLFTALAFVAIILNHQLQRKDLEEQRKEMTKAASRHGELLEAHRQALQLAAYQTMIGSNHQRLESARARGLKREAEQTEADIADLVEKVARLAQENGDGAAAGP
jgi:hypothetical protein